MKQLLIIPSTEMSGTWGDLFLSYGLSLVVAILVTWAINKFYLEG